MRRVDSDYAWMKRVIQGLSYDLAVLQANDIIDRELRGEVAIRAFQDESEGLIESVRTFGRESSKRLGLSSRKQEKEGVDLAQSFREVGADLRRLTEIPVHAVYGSSNPAQSSVPERMASSMEKKTPVQPESPRKQGRPAIPMEIKRQALEAKQKPGNTNKDAAKSLYGTARPTLRQVKNVATILGCYQNHQG